MMLSDNLSILKQRFPILYEQMKDYQRDNSDKKVEIVEAKSGIPTLYYKTAEAQVFIHSKYNPLDEAAKLLEKYSDISKYRHVFFFGIGLGYHIEAFMDKYSSAVVSLYEPDKEIFGKFISFKSLNRLLRGRVASIYTGEEYKEIHAAASHFANLINGDVLFITLPSYERIFDEKYKAFLEAFHKALTNKRASLKAQTNFQKLWATNSVKNFKEVMNSPNILQDKKQYFTGKPAIIAAAGPSLGEELENLRLIKEKGLAYIFSVGSAINTLLASNIMPDAVCIYDPGTGTGEVIRKVKEQNLDIPLVFGSSVYSGAVQGYPGFKLHMLTSQDTISAYLLKNNNKKELERIIDSPSVAIVALQMLVKLGCTPIILVGQNFAFKNRRYYAQGIDYRNRSGELNSVDVDSALEVEDDHGGKVQTSQLFNLMRNQMELYIEYSGCKDIINSTKGGARIKGTVFKPLGELMDNELLNKSVDNSWLADEHCLYDINYMISQGELMVEDRERAERLITELIDTLNTLKSEYDTKLLQKGLSRFEKAYNRLIENQFFNYILRPMNRVQFELTAKKITDISIMKDIEGKARFITETFINVFELCKKDMDSIKYEFDDMIDEIMENDIKVITFTIRAS